MRTSHDLSEGRVSAPLVGHAGWGEGVAEAVDDSAWDPRVLRTLETRMEHGNHWWCAA